MREQFEEIICELVMFDNEDVIITSGTSGDDSSKDFATDGDED